MKVSTAILGLAAIAGVGYVVAKRVLAAKRKEDDGEDYGDVCCCCEAEDKGGNKLKKASLFAVGAIKTGADKVAEGINEIATADMVKKGEDTIELAKETTDGIRKELEDIKNMLVSINLTPNDEEPLEESEGEAAEAVSDTFDETISENTQNKTEETDNEEIDMM